jgi:pyocin large subunit-like protein
MNIRMLLLAGVALSLSACDNGPSAVRTRERSETASPSSETTTVAREDDAGRSDRARTARRRDGTDTDRSSDIGDGLKWAANRKHSADDNAHYQFDKRGAEFGAADFKAYVAKADAFVAHPPQGVLKLERSNGDVLLYDPKSNVFVVADKTGAPRTMFKPPEGMAYWDEQKDQQKSREARRKDRAGDNGEKS